MPRFSTLVLATERACETVKSSGRRAEYRIKGTRNLVLRVAPKGNKSWTFRYLSPMTGRWRRISFGSFPMVGLDSAKTQAITILAAVKTGRDPLAAPPASEMTFEELVRAYLAEHRQRCSSAWTREVERMLRADILPILKSLRIESVAKTDVVRVVERVAARGAFEAADHVLGLMRAIYSWGVGTGRTELDPTRGLKKRNFGRPRERLLTDEEVRTVWKALNSQAVSGHALSLGIRDALKLQLLLGLRIGEAVGARKAEVDLNERVWTIPTIRTKSRREHRLPLSNMALNILSTAMERSPSSRWLFPSPVDGKSIRPKSASRAIIRLRRRLGLADFGTHDLRRTAATRLGDLGVSDELIGRILNHAPSGVTRRHYNHAPRFVEMRMALEMWSAKVQELVR